MHIAAPEVGFVTATGVVGGNIPLALGAALSSNRRGGSDVAVAFFGDGAVQTGLFHECLNLASLWQLPVLLVCENNGFAEFSPISSHTVVERLADHADTYGIPTETIDGNDLTQVRPAAVAAIERARSGGGPSFLECLTHRLRGHYEGDPTRKRGPAAVDEGKDPIQRFVHFLYDGAKDGELEGIEARVRAEVEQAAEEALSAPWPEPDDLMTNVVAQT
jgi:pyruvate dehydrogenase E1 component alpha subunit